MNYTLKLNAKFQPFSRHDLEDLLDEFLGEENLGKTTGGGTSTDDNGEVEYCDIEIELNENPNALDKLLTYLEEIGIPKGSKIYNENYEKEIGILEGLAIYTNGTDLPDEVYQNFDINVVYDTISKILDDVLVLTSYYEGNTETGLYFYVRGTFEEAKNRIAQFVSEYPLCEKCRIVKIA